MAVLALWLTYAAACAAALGLARRFVAPISARTGLLLALLPLVLTGKAMLLGQLYGPSDLYFSGDPWRELPAAAAAGPVRNPILSDLAFANLPWRAALREALANGRAPLWNRFVLAGNPLLATAQAAVFHPATWIGIWLPLALSWTFSCVFTLFLALLSAFLFFRDLELEVPAALVGAAGWGFSTYVVFWLGWSVGPSTATFPLLLLGLRRLAAGRRGIGLTAAALLLSLAGGHPESFFHASAAGGVAFLFELAARRGRGATRAVGGALAAGVLACLLGGPQLYPLLEAIPRSAEYRARREASAADAAASVAPREFAARLLPDLLPFAHGIYGKSPVDGRRLDGAGMPLGYAGAVLFPLAALGVASRRAGRLRWMFLGFFAGGLAYGASAPLLMELTERLPGFSLALNYRLVFLAGFGAAGLAALGVGSLAAPGGARRLALTCLGFAALLGVAIAAAQPVFADRGLDRAFVFEGFGAEALPLVALAAASLALRRRPSAVAAAALVGLVAQRGWEMHGTYPTLPAWTLAPALPGLGALPLGSEPWRVVAKDGVFRPNASALYGLEDVRGYESLVLDRFADTFPLWSRPLPASFNRVDDLASPALSLLNVRYAIAAPFEPTPAGWLEQVRSSELAVFTNPRALERAFVPKRLRREANEVAALAAVADFRETAIVSGGGPREQANGAASVHTRAAGPDLVVEVSAASRSLVATSLPDWPGWRAESQGAALETETVNHAFVGFWVPPGTRTVRLRYAPHSWRLGLWAAGAGAALAAAAIALSRSRAAS